MNGMKVEELKWKIQMNDSKVGKVKKSVRVGHEEFLKLERTRY